MCAGFGTRLEPISLFLPKALLPILGRPLLDHIIDNVSESSDAKSFIIYTNRKFADQFKYYIENKRRARKDIELILEIEEAVKENERLGMIGGIARAVEKHSIDDDLFIISGDNFFDFSINGMIERFYKDHFTIISLYKLQNIEEAKRFGNVFVEDDKVKGFEEKPAHPKTNIISMGAYIFPKGELGLFRKYLDEGNNKDAIGYFLEWYIKKKELHCMTFEGIWSDIGTIDSYMKTVDSVRKESV
jgi:glucose-1-phosphate thymidylyltransferase